MYIYGGQYDIAYGPKMLGQLGNAASKWGIWNHEHLSLVIFSSLVFMVEKHFEKIVSCFNNQSYVKPTWIDFVEKYH